MSTARRSMRHRTSAAGDPGDAHARRAAARQRVPSAASQEASVPWRSQSHSPAAGEAVVST